MWLSHLLLYFIIFHLYSPLSFGGLQRNFIKFLGVTVKISTIINTWFSNDLSSRTLSSCKQWKWLHPTGWIQSCPHNGTQTMPVPCSLEGQLPGNHPQNCLRTLSLTDRDLPAVILSLTSVHKRFSWLDGKGCEPLSTSYLIYFSFLLVGWGILKSQKNTLGLCYAYAKTGTILKPWDMAPLGLGPHSVQC